MAKCSVSLLQHQFAPVFPHMIVGHVRQPQTSRMMMMMMCLLLSTCRSWSRNEPGRRQRQRPQRRQSWRASVQWEDAAHCHQPTSKPRTQVSVKWPNTLTLKSQSSCEIHDSSSPLCVVLCISARLMFNLCPCDAFAVCVELVVMTAFIRNTD